MERSRRAAFGMRQPDIAHGGALPGQWRRLRRFSTQASGSCAVARPSPMAERTIFNTPVLEPLLRSMSRGVLRLLGWRVEGELSPRAARCVVIAAPHTSNWDFPFTLLAAFALGMHIRWLGKAS